jgi:hypothetical protein
VSELTAASELLRIPRVLLATWAVLICVLVTLPVVVTLARESRFEATFETAANRPVSPSALATSVRRLVRDPIVALSTVTDSHVMLSPAALADRVTVVTSARSVLVRVWGRTPEEARSLSEALGPELAEGAARKEGWRLVLIRKHFARPQLLDRTADALPGAFPKRQSPAWVGFAGLVVAIIVCVGIGFLGPRAHGGSGTAE